MLESQNFFWSEIRKACKSFPLNSLKKMGIYVYLLDTVMQQSLEMPFKVNKFIILQTANCKPLENDAELIDDDDSLYLSCFTCFTGADVA